MEFFFEFMAWLALGLGIVFIAWKIYLFIAWNIERAIFLTSVSYYLRTNSKRKAETQ